MGILGKLFGSKKPAPSYEIHPDDEGLVKSQDIDWLKTITMDDLKAIEQQDNIARMTLYTYCTETKGMSKEDALNEVKISFPIYYLTLTQRSDKPFTEGEDAKLPYILKNRINNAIIPKLSKELMSNGVHIHSLIRGHLKSS
jgi:hypothetical protein